MSNAPAVLKSLPAAVLRFTGEDHAEFLQGQGTADLRGPVGLCRYTLFLDHRGNIQADGFVLRDSCDSLLLASCGFPAAGLLERFERYIIADDVEVADLTGQYRLTSVLAADASGVLGLLNSDAPGPGRFIPLHGGMCFNGRRAGPGSLDFLLPSGAGDVFQALPDLDPAAAEAARVAGGVPAVAVDCVPAGLNPIEAGLAGAVSFEKGCYLGQEVVTRVQRLGRVSRRLVRISGADALPQVPCEILHAGQPVGALTSVVKFPHTWCAIGHLKSRVPDGEQEFGSATWSVHSLSSDA